MWDVSPVPEANTQHVFYGQNKFCADRVWKHGVQDFSASLLCHQCTLYLGEDSLGCLPFPRIALGVFIP